MRNWCRLRSSVAFLLSMLCGFAAVSYASAQPSKAPVPAADALTACLAAMAPGTWRDAAKCVDTAPTLWSVAYGNVKRPPPPLTYSAATAAHIFAVSGPDGIMSIWSGGTWDSDDRMLVVGNAGNHQGYWGDELYAFRASTLSWIRLNDPSDTTGYICGDMLMPNGNPANMHTYGNLAYDSATNSVIQAQMAWLDLRSCRHENPPYSGPYYGNSAAVTAFNMKTRKWSIIGDYSQSTYMHQGGGCLSPDLIVGLDETTRRLYYTISDSHCNAAYWDLGTKTMNMAAGGGHNSDYHMAGGAIRPGVQMVNMGRMGGLNVLDFSSGMTRPHATGDLTCQNYEGPQGQQAGGIQWDAAAKKYVAMAPGTSTVCLLDPSNWNWTAVTMGGDVPSLECPGCNGVFGRFVYDPQDDCLLYVGGVREHVFIGKKSW